MRECGIGSKTKKLLLTVSLTAIVLLCFAAMFYYQEVNTLPREKDREFSGKGTDIRLDDLTELQAESLYKLCKIWGYAKYRHPSVIDGTLHWDYELLRVMPMVLSAGDGEETNQILAEWLNGFPFEIPAVTQETQMYLSVQEKNGYGGVNTDWISDSGLFGKEVCQYLSRLSQVYISDRKHAFASFTSDDFEGGKYVTFKHEMNIPFQPEDDGVKLLSLFRFWNIYEYYSPNVRITKMDWDQALREAIPNIVQTENKRDYVLAIAQAAAETGDGHLTVADKGLTLFNYYGRYYLPCTFEQAEGEIVVSCTDGSGELKAGDIIRQIDGISIEERIRTLSRYTALPEEDKFTNQLQYSLLKSDKERADVKLVRDGKEISLSVRTKDAPAQFQNPYKNGLLKDNIGYIDPSSLKEGELEKLMETFKDTDGIIVALRYYPSVNPISLLAEYVTPEPTVFAWAGFANPALPGSFWLMKEELKSGAGTLAETGGYKSYTGRLILLMDQRTQSHGEFTVMSLRQAPGAVVVGSPSVGADGNVTAFSLPGDISMNITGLGVYTPEGGQTQRVGLQPDVECLKTIEGIRAGRDELIEKAMELIEE